MQQESTETQSTKPSGEQSAKSKSTTKRKRTRTKKTKESSKGLGDTIAKVTEATGIDKVVKAVAGDDCGCKERQAALNKLFPYAQPMNEESKKTWETVLAPAWKHGRLRKPEQIHLVNVYQQVYGQRRKFTNCGSCLVTALKKLKQAYELSCE